MFNLKIPLKQLFLVGFLVAVAFLGGRERWAPTQACSAFKVWRTANSRADYFRFLASGKIALGISIEDHSLFGIIPEMAPRFSEMNKVRVVCERLGKYEGYVIASQFRDGRWIYKISILEDPRKSETFDNWIPEECLELTR